MVRLLFLALLAVPVVEIYLLIQVGGAIGALPTLGLLLLSAVIGVIIIKRQGLGMVRLLQSQVRVGDNPGNDLLDGALVIVAGVLLVLPGFLSDAVALLLLVPPVRHVVGSRISRRLQAHVTRLANGAGMSGAGMSGAGMSYGATGVYDARVVDDLGDVTPPQWQHPSDDGATRSSGNELTP